MKEVEEYILSLKNEQRQLMLYLHDLFSQGFNLTGKIRYGIPFYDNKQWLCYLNPLKDGGVDLTFLKGSQMLQQFEELEKRDRKMVSTLPLQKLELVDEARLKEMIAFAIQLEEEANHK